MAQAYFQGTAVAESDLISIIDWMDANIAGWNKNNYRCTGTHEQKMVQVATKMLGLNAKFINTEWCSLTDFLDGKHIVIIHADSQPQNGTTTFKSGASHWLILERISGGFAYIDDPGRSADKDGNSHKFTESSVRARYEARGKLAIILDKKATCLDECSPGSKRCRDGQTEQTCSQANGCWTWGQDVWCQHGCAGNACSSCQDSCSGDVCGNGKLEGNEVCDGSNLSGQSCSTQGFDGGTLACGGSCTSFNTSKCCKNQCSQQGTSCSGNTVVSCSPGASGCLQSQAQQTCQFGCSEGQCLPPPCQPSCASGQCGGSDGCGGVCSAPCSNGQNCQANFCGCPTSNSGQFNLLNSDGGAGCATDGGVKLKVTAQMLNATMVRFFVTKSDGSSWGAPATLSLYVGSGPTCPNPPNVAKATTPVVVGQKTQTIDLMLNPYNGSWGLNETKLFWIGKDESGWQSVRATGTISIQRTCLP
jgi:hypothetical protein